MRIRATAILFALLTVRSTHAQVAALGDVNGTSDADHFDAFHLRSGVLFGYASPFQYKGVATQITYYTQSNWQRDAPAIFVLWRNQKRDTLEGTIGEAGLVRIAGRIRLIGDATWSLRAGKKTGIELLAAGDLVETRRALEDATAYTFAGASVERQLTPRVTAIGLVGYQRFTDGNERLHLRGRLIWVLIPEHGISAQLRWRQYEANQLDVDSAYFNPHRYREWQGGLAIRKRHAGWTWTGNVAAGRESIDRARDQTTALAELRAEKLFDHGVRFVAHASYNRSAGFANADDYWYRSAGITLIMPF